MRWCEPAPLDEHVVCQTDTVLNRSKTKRFINQKKSHKDWRTVRSSNMWSLKHDFLLKFIKCRLCFRCRSEFMIKTQGVAEMGANRNRGHGHLTGCQQVRRVQVFLRPSLELKRIAWDTKLDPEPIITFKSNYLNNYCCSFRTATLGEDSSMSVKCSVHLMNRGSLMVRPWQKFNISDQSLFKERINQTLTLASIRYNFL